MTHFLYPLTLLFPLMHFAKTVTYNKYICCILIRRKTTCIFYYQEYANSLTNSTLGKKTKPGPGPNMHI